MVRRLLIDPDMTDRMLEIAGASLQTVRGGVLQNGPVYRAGFTKYMDRACGWTYLPARLGFTGPFERCTNRNMTAAQDAGTAAAKKAGVPIMEDVPSSIRPDLDPGGRQLSPELR